MMISLAILHDQFNSLRGGFHNLNISKDIQSVIMSSHTSLDQARIERTDHTMDVRA